ncbi:hypothetical protein LOZ58_004961 [Ophidiomyces ophidiicola]|nr:hypothetical protein LOZ65_002738 [Ophidiomyces ophidiicola]KAI1958924.1 hypothetical protein LOZ58_004961 [Ophidiomyces ophidiicola]
MGGGEHQWRVLDAENARLNAVEMLVIARGAPTAGLQAQQIAPFYGFVKFNEHNHFTSNKQNSSGALSAGVMQPSFQEQHTLPQTTSHTLHSAPANCSPCALLHSAFDCETANGNNLSNRSPYIQGYPMSYDEDTNYSMSQSQPAMLVTGNMPDGGVFDSPTPTKAWYDSSQIKPLQGSFPDSDANNTLATSSCPFLLQQSAATDNVSVFPLMNPLSASLTSDRTLPTPAGLRNNTFPPLASISENLNTGNVPNLKSTWGLDKHFLSDFGIPRDSSSAGSSTTSLERCKPPASPPDLGFGYIPISSHARGPAVTSPCTFADTFAFSDRFRTASEPKCSKVSLREKIPDFYTSEVYGYERCRGSRGNLVSGDIYIRNPADSEPISIVRPDSIRRPTPIPALNNI